jgi:hypothetical protein
MILSLCCPGRNLAFIKDPDGYWIEVLTPDNAETFVQWNDKEAVTP